MRHHFSLSSDPVNLPDLTVIAKDSYAWLKNEGINEILEEINPIEDQTGRQWELAFSDSKFGKSKTTASHALKMGLTYNTPWFLKATLKDLKTNKKEEGEIYFGDFPKMTDRGTFIINGVERVVINQLTRSEGVFFLPGADTVDNHSTVLVKVLPKNGVWLEFETTKTGVITVKIDRKRKLAATALLRIFGLESNEEILKTFESVDTNPNLSFIEQTLGKDASTSYNSAILEIFRKLRPGEPVILKNAKTFIESTFFSPQRYSLDKVGRFKLNLRLGLDFPNAREYWLLQKEDLIQIIKTIIQISNGLGEFDDVDNLANRRVRSVGELVQMQLRIGLLQMERNIRERMSLQPRDKLCRPRQLISSRPIMARLHSFFASSQLSQFMSQQNPLDGLDHIRRLSVMGPGGLKRERASFSVRDAHFSHYGRICPVRTPEGPNIGLITYLALFARVNEYGFLEAPYRKVEKIEKDGKILVRVTDDIEYLAAYDEKKYFITDASIETDEKGFIIEENVPLRQKGKFFFGNISQVDYIDLTPRQIVGVSASLIPFLANDDVNRALMAANMQVQAVPLILPEIPYVGTGLEKQIAYNSGTLVIAEKGGEVVYVDNNKITIKEKNKKKRDYELQKFTRSNQETCYNQHPIVKVKQKVKKGAVLADGASTKNGELALGTNLRVAYMSWDGLGYEDAIVVSDRLVKEDILTSAHIAEHKVLVLETRLGPEEITRDIPNVSEETLRNLDEGGIVRLGAQVKSGDILVGKIAPKGETELSAEERLLRAIFGEKARDVRDNALRMPHGEQGTVIGIKIIKKEENKELPTGVVMEIHVFVAQVRKIMVGDKLAGRHGNKGVISKIISFEDMPHFEDGTPIDLIFSPASVISRMNLGQLQEAHLGWAGEKLNKFYAIPAFDEIPENELRKEFETAGISLTGKAKLIDGRTGEYFDNEIAVGNAHILKLLHLSEDKIHARSIGPYALITQQPLGGKAQFGGQRFGEMEVWALEAYSSAHTLREMLTIKSDDMLGRTKAYRAIIQGAEIPEAAIPESFKLLVRELNGLCLDVETVGDKEKQSKQ